MDMEAVPSIQVPGEYCSIPRMQLNAFNLATTPPVGFSPRLRSAHAKRVVDTLWPLLPDTAEPWGREAVARKMADTFYVDAGAEAAMGRVQLAYPKPTDRIRHPVTVAEAQLAVERCGLDLRGLVGLRPYPLVTIDDQQKGVRVNPKGGNGFPVLGKWEDPAARERCIALAFQVRRELEALPAGEKAVDGWKSANERGRPWLVACQGKAKADYYSGEKIRSLRLRFYNVLPRQIVMNMQVATQVLEDHARNILDGPDYTSAQGVSLVRGGARALVDALDLRLQRDGYTYTHVGDDSWVVVRTARGLVMFALDCSNFDLTQHAEATREVHRAIAHQLESVDVLAARLWHSYMRSRVVVVAGAVAYRLKHAGPSGSPLQSKVNDVLMEVLLSRTFAGLDASTRGRFAEPEWAEERLRSVARGLGFQVRLEQHSVTQGARLQQVLQQQPFLFIGYYFYATSNEEVRVVIDLPRCLAQLRYPGLKWVREGGEFGTTEAMRLGCILLGAGVPPPSLEAAFGAWHVATLSLLDEAAKADPAGFTAENSKLRWAVGETPAGPEVPPSLAGLWRALEHRQELWVGDAGAYEAELRAQREYEEKVLRPALEARFGQVVDAIWADLVEEEEEELNRALPPAASPPADLPPLPPYRVPTHPVTDRNHGRPPPVAVWGPPKPPRVRHGRRQRASWHISEDSVTLQGRESEDDWDEDSAWWDRYDLEDFESELSSWE